MTTIFGGKQGKSFRDYLQTMKLGIAVQLQKQIEKNATEEGAKKEVREMFLLAKLNFDISKGEVIDTHSERYEDITTKEGVRRAYMKRYSYTIPFTGDQNVIKLRPETFHGSDKEGKISGNDTTKQNSLTVYFRSEMNNQAQFDHSKSESIGELYQNCIEINKEIENWNNKQLEDAIGEIYPKVLAHVNEAKEFEKRNDIKK